MFFILSKVLFFLIVPFVWVLILLLMSWLLKNQRIKKRLRIAALLICIVFTNPFLYRTLVMAWQPGPVKIASGKNYSMGILLGGLSGYDKFNRGYFGDDADRFIATANLYHRGIIQKIIVSGGTGKLSQDEPAEAFFLHEQLIANGIKESDIFIESQSRNTYENGLFSKRILDSLHAPAPFVLITSAMHMPRSVAVFTKAGVPVIPYPCDYKVVPKKWEAANTIVPDIKVMNDWTDFIKEMIGYWVYKFTGKA
jgi:uncharacterized SAM-binding protein YcdF (DUF218 family)